MILLLLFVGCVAFGIGILRHYSERADKYDLATVHRVGSGSIALDANGKLLGQVALKDRRHVNLENVPEHLIQAIIATEDHRFRAHNGVDLKGIARAFVANLKAGGITQGGSTITQQLARHAFDLGGRTINRKMAELFLARRIEKRFTKNEILEAYLNRIYLGSGFWGVGAAARGYFGKDVSELDLSESATIAALIKSPNRLSPFNDLETATVARNRTLRRMSELGMISEEKESEIAAIEVELISPEERAQRPHYLLAAIRKEALDILGQYSDLSELEISTTVDFYLQTRAKSMLDDQLARIERNENFAHKSKSDSSVEKSTDYLQGALVVLENKTGKIISAVGGRDYADSQYDRVWQSRRAPGTSLVPFVYAHAFESGIVTPFTKVLDAPLDNKKVMIGGTGGILGEWGTETLDNDYEGEIPAVYALARGKNGVAVRVGQQLGVDSFGQMLTDAGVKSKLNGYSNSFLGESPINLLELVHAYTVFPNLGTRADKLRMITSIKDREGNVVYSAPRSAQPVPVMSEGTASIINSVLSKTFEIDPIRLLSRDFGEGFAGKAGTSYEFKDNWFVGYDADYTWGVWIGFDKPKPIYENAFGSITAFPVWRSIASALSSEKPVPLSSKVAKDDVCLLSGKPATEFCRHTETGNLAARLPLEQSGDPSPASCEIHQSKTEPLDFDAVAEPGFEPDLFSGFTPVEPKVEVVIGHNPWTVEAKRD
ncbi:MAG: transglycosylase domain-containing protein [Verrucomicrobiales bacterium]